MIIVLFRSRLTAEAGEDYEQMAGEMLATACEMPGFIDFKTFQAADDERLSVIRWKDDETLKQWRSHPRHRVAQRNGRTKWYQYFQIEVAEVVRHSAFDRP